MTDGQVLDFTKPTLGFGLSNLVRKVVAVSTGGGLSVKSTIRTGHRTHAMFMSAVGAIALPHSPR